MRKREVEIGMAIFTDYIIATILFNLQILPEALVSGIFILAILLANYSLFAVAAGAGGTQLVTGAIGRLIMKFAPDSAYVRSSMDMCSAGYVGKSWDRLLRGSSAPELLWHPWAPSVYLATIGFFGGWGAALQQLYKEEINAGILSRSTLLTTGIITGLLLLLALLFRIFSGCESLLGALGGIGLGLSVGYFAAIALGYSTDRRATNIWGIPLLVDRINNGSPVYLCPTKKTDK
jgi:hypothetical protein